MKKNDWIIILAVAAYSYLFYHQIPGINLFLFTLLIVGLIWYKQPADSGRLSWRGAVLGSIFSGFFVFLYGTPLSVIANIISLTGLAALSLNPGSSVLMAGVNSVYSYLSAIPYMIIDYSNRKRNNSEKGGTSLFIKFLMLGIPIFITVIFFMLYRSANPIFYNLTKEWSFDFIPLSWLGFTLLGFIWLYGLFFQRTLPVITQLDLNASCNLNLESLKDREETILGKILSVKNEMLSALVMLSLLNLLLLAVNIVDLSYLWSGLELPKGMTYSDYVHEGTAAIVFSVFSAILIILFYFRGHLNFANNNKGIRLLAYIWIIQNIFMVSSTALKNHLYIEEYSLTFQRVGVYVFLLLTFIGLITTFIKVYKLKSNVFLFRKNAWAFYAVLIISVSVNWTQVVTDYNIRNSKDLDLEYLAELDYKNIPTLLGVIPKPTDTRFIKALNRKIEDFKWEYENTGWQSRCYYKYKVYSLIKNQVR